MMTRPYTMPLLMLFGLLTSCVAVTVYGPPDPRTVGKEHCTKMIDIVFPDLPAKPSLTAEQKADRHKSDEILVGSIGEHRNYIRQLQQQVKDAVVKQQSSCQ